jgi:hypothetical protein
VDINCGEIDKHSVSGYNEFVGMEHIELKPVEQMIVSHVWDTQKVIMR